MRGGEGRGGEGGRETEGGREGGRELGGRGREGERGWGFLFRVSHNFTTGFCSWNSATPLVTPRSVYHSRLVVLSVCHQP
jgi:hypothetical protein